MSITHSTVPFTGRAFIQAITVLAIGTASVAVQASPVIYNQPQASPSTLGVFSSAGGFTAFDDFTLANGATITDLHWHGGFTTGSEGTAISSFTIEFWNDNAGQPGSSAQAAQTFTGSAGQTNAHACVGTFTCYDYTLDPISFFHANAGTRYWISIVADTGGATAPAWFWVQGTGGDGISYSRDTSGAFTQVPVDLAFDLTGTADGTVPEPATLALLGFGLAGLGMSRRKRR